jgi:hypothetical protein
VIYCLNDTYSLEAFQVNRYHRDFEGVHYEIVIDGVLLAKFVNYTN